MFLRSSPSRNRSPSRAPVYLREACFSPNQLNEEEARAEPVRRVPRGKSSARLRRDHRHQRASDRRVAHIVDVDVEALGAKQSDLVVLEVTVIGTLDRHATAFAQSRSLGE